jgi:hypothetical protein
MDNVHKAFDAIKKIHEKGVIHGDLKPAHLRQYSESKKVFFIDFGCSVDYPLAHNSGFTALYASIDSLVMRTVHPLDDYEAVLVAALESISCLPTLPHQIAPPAEESLKKWLRWKMELMDTVYATHAQRNNPFLAFLLDKLLLVWAMPRSCGWISDDNVVKLMSDQDHASAYLKSLQVELVRDFTAALGRAQPRERDQPVHDFALCRTRLKVSLC